MTNRNVCSVSYVAVLKKKADFFATKHAFKNMVSEIVSHAGVNLWSHERARKCEWVVKFPAPSLFFSLVFKFVNTFQKNRDF